MINISFKKLITAALLTLNVSGCYALKSPDTDTRKLISSSDSNFAIVNKPEQLTAEQKKAVFKYAPVIFQETNKKARPEYWDFLTSFDFDGDLKGNNNEKNMVSNKFALPANLYYSIIESETHYFITYSSYHPLDWDTLPSFIPYTWHENDMENLQVVVRKKTDFVDEAVVLVAAQAHLETDLITEKDAKIKSAQKELSTKDFRLLSADLKSTGTHCALYLESGGHGIHNINTNSNKFAKLNPPKLKEGFTFIPSESNLPEVYSKGTSTYHYQLKSTYDTFWNDYLTDSHIGDGKLLTGSFNYKDELVDYKKLPRFFDSSRISGPGKKAAGILPFAFSYNLLSNDLGVIFFNPAKKYAETLKIRDKWSKKYVYNPYVRDIIKLSKVN